MIIATDVRHRFENNGSVWTLTVPEMPAPGALIEFTTPAVGSCASRTQRGWITADQTYARPGTFCVSTEGSIIWAEFVVERPARSQAGPNGRQVGAMPSYIVTIPVANDLPSLTVVRATAKADSGARAEKLAVTAAVSVGWVVDTRRAVTTEPA